MSPQHETGVGGICLCPMGAASIASFVTCLLSGDVFRIPRCSTGFFPKLNPGRIYFGKAQTNESVTSNDSIKPVEVVIERRTLGQPRKRVVLGGDESVATNQFSN